MFSSPDPKGHFELLPSLCVCRITYHSLAISSETTRPVETKFCRNVLEIPYKKYSFQLDFIHGKFMVL